MIKTCEKCGEDFEHLQIVDGKSRNLQRRRYCLTCSPFGAKNTKKLHIVREENETHRKCSKCNILKELNEENFYRRRDRTNNEYHYYCRQCSSDNSKMYQKERKKFAVDYKGGKCCKCGYDKCIAAMDFHHLDPNEKDYEPSKLFTQSKSYETIKNELDKCILVCSNCHREIHDEIKSQAKGIMSQYSRNIWPSNDELEKLILEMPLMELSKHLKVSHNSLRNRLKTENIQIPSTEYWRNKKERP